MNLQEGKTLHGIEHVTTLNEAECSFCWSNVVITMGFIMMLQGIILKMYTHLHCFCCCCSLVVVVF